MDYGAFAAFLHDNFLWLLFACGVFVLLSCMWCGIAWLKTSPLGAWYLNVLVALGLYNFGIELHKNLFLSMAWAPDKYMARAEKAQREKDKAIADNVWSGLVQSETGIQPAIDPSALHQLQVKNRKTSGVVEPVAQPGNTIGKTKGKKGKKNSCPISS